MFIKVLIFSRTTEELPTTYERRLLLCPLKIFLDLFVNVTLLQIEYLESYPAGVTGVYLGRGWLTTD